MKMSRKSLKMHLEKLLRFQHGDGEKLFETAFEWLMKKAKYSTWRRIFVHQNSSAFWSVTWEKLEGRARHKISGRHWSSGSVWIQGETSFAPWKIPFNCFIWFSAYGKLTLSGFWFFLTDSKFGQTIKVFHQRVTKHLLAKGELCRKMASVPDSEQQHRCSLCPLLTCRRGQSI